MKAVILTLCTTVPLQIIFPDIPLGYMVMFTLVLYHVLRIENKLDIIIEDSCKRSH